MPHVAKNIVQSVVNNERIYIPKDIQKDYNLPTNVVDAAHLIEMIKKTQEESVFTLTYNLTVNDVNLPKSKYF